MALESKSHSIEPAEAVHNWANTTEKKSQDEFLNPGTPQNPLVSMEDRKTGVIAGAASQQLRERLTPAANESIAMSKKVSGNEGMLPSGK